MRRDAFRFPQIAVTMLIAISAALLSCAEAGAQSTNRQLADYLDSNSIGFVRIDVKKSDAGAIAELAKSIGFGIPQFEPALNQIRATGGEILGQLTTAGAEQLFVSYSLSDIGRKPNWPFVVIPKTPELQLDQLAAIVRNFVPIPVEVVDAGETVFIGQKAVWQRINNQRHTRPDAQTILEAGNSGGCQHCDCTVSRSSACDPRIDAQFSATV